MAHTSIPASRPIEIMGIINLTPDSFFEGSRTFTPEGAFSEETFRCHLDRHLEGGANIIDLGACSTRPGADLVDLEEEWRRLRQALEILRKEYPDTALSVDTFRGEIVRRCYDTIGPFTVNDVTSGEGDPEMLPTVGDLRLPYVAMHSRGVPKTMSDLTDYSQYGKDASVLGISEVTEGVRLYFKEFEEKARAFGIDDWILDPGFGFAKTVSQNYSLLKDLRVFKDAETGFPDRKLLVGISRKSMIWKRFSLSPGTCLPETQTLHLIALERGADILRVHDCAEAARTLEIYKDMCG